MVAEFVSLSLEFDKDDSKYQHLEQYELDSAQKRHDKLLNKTKTSLSFVDILKELTNLDSSTDPNSSSSLDSDASYQASIKIVSNITQESSSFDDARANLLLLKDSKDAISSINSQPLKIFSTKNSALGDLSSSDSDGVKALNSNSSWDSSKEVITFSFNQTIPQEYYDYDDGTLVDGWQPFSFKQEGIVRSIVDDINSKLGVTLKEVSSDGDIRFNRVDMSDGIEGFAFLPQNNYAVDGDVFLSSGDIEYEYMTIAHELGHALGLEHPFEGDNILSYEYDDTNHTVMSYTNNNNTIPTFTDRGSTIEVSYSYIYPLYYSLYDISTLHLLYGANLSSSSTDDTYTLKYSDNTIKTIYDSGGHDSIDLSDTMGATTLDMNSGSVNSVDYHTLEEIVELYQVDFNDQVYKNWIEQKVTNLYNQGDLYSGKNNLSIAVGTTIEDIKTGSGDDSIVDNEVDNSIITNSGNDSIYLGSGGSDSVDGGDGYDKLYLNVNSSDTSTIKLDEDHYLLAYQDFVVNFTDIEEVVFTDTTSTPDLLI
jgi:hypothetical protein